MQQAREVIATLIFERQEKEKIARKRNNQEQKELEKLKEQLDNPILSIVRYLLSGKNKDDTIGLIDLAKNSNIYKDDCETRVIVNLIKNNLVSAINSFLEYLSVHRVAKKYKVLS
jgi:serine/threonine-protein kinase RIO1